MKKLWMVGLPDFILFFLNLTLRLVWVASQLESENSMALEL